MKLQKIEIQNFRRLKTVEIILSPASFLVGPNNVGKSSIISAIEALLSLEKEKCTPLDILLNTDDTRASEMTITGHFGGLSPEVASSRGFRGRVINGEYTYRKIVPLNGKVKIECLEYTYSKNPEVATARTFQDLVNAGITEERIRESVPDFELTAKLKTGWERDFPELLTFNTAEDPVWVANPGGIPQNVQSKLPRMLRIPSLTDLNAVQSQEKKHIIGECLSLLFEDLISQTTLKDEIQQKLTALQGEMDPNNPQSSLRTLISDVNSVIQQVFPNCGVNITPSMQDLAEVLKPKYEIRFFSNIQTEAEKQGTGFIRTTAFAILRQHARMRIARELQTRPILVAFEEPETFLHPQAANLLRDTIYSLAQSDQIVCTTHSPQMIDLTKDPISITRLSIGADSFTSAINYGLSSAISRLPDDDKKRVKMIQAFDDEVSRVFFSEKVVIVEGDTEAIAIKEFLNKIPEDKRRNILSKFQVVRARGKQTIISLIKYFHELCILPIVIHDLDTGVAGAERFNPLIASAVNDTNRLFPVTNCIENVLGYTPPSSDKPFKAFEKVHSWANFQQATPEWKRLFEGVFETQL